MSPSLFDKDETSSPNNILMLDSTNTKKNSTKNSFESDVFNICIKNIQKNEGFK